MHDFGGNGASLLEVSLKKAANLSSSERSGALILNAVKMLMVSIESDANPEKLTHYAAFPNEELRLDTHVLVHDLVGAVRTTMEWIARKETGRGSKCNMYEIKKEIDDGPSNNVSLCNVTDTGFITVKQEDGESLFMAEKAEDDESEGPGAWSDEEESNESDSEEETSRRKRPKKKNDSTRKVKLIKCDECGKSFTAAGTLRVHKLTHLNDANAKRPYACDQCDKRFTQAGSLSVHKRKHLDESDPRLLKFKQSWKCKHCDKEFNNRSVLALHQRTHLGEDERRSGYMCQYCGRGFTQRSGLAQHERLHTRDLPYKCDQCPRMFNRNNEFQRHLRAHADGRSKISIVRRKHQCTVCPKRFAKDYELAAHLKRHAENTVGSSSDTEEELRQCAYCDKDFANEAELDQHLVYCQRAHYRPFACSLCNYRSKLRGPLDCHMMLVHGAVIVPFKRPLKCAHCPKFFVSEFTLENHMKSHKTITTGSQHT